MLPLSSSLARKTPHRIWNMEYWSYHHNHHHHHRHQQKHHVCVIIQRINLFKCWLVVWHSCDSHSFKKYVSGFWMHLLIFQSEYFDFRYKCFFPFFCIPVTFTHKRAFKDRLQDSNIDNSNIISSMLYKSDNFQEIFERESFEHA